MTVLQRARGSPAGSRRPEKRIKGFDNVTGE